LAHLGIKHLAILGGHRVTPRTCTEAIENEIRAKELGFVLEQEHALQMCAALTGDLQCLALGGGDHDAFDPYRFMFFPPSPIPESAVGYES
jgi:hypothetical protein